MMLVAESRYAVGRVFKLGRKCPRLCEWGYLAAKNEALAMWADSCPAMHAEGPG
jgi:hypothetical protein